MDGLVGKNRLKDIWKRIFSAMKIITGDVDFENDGTLQKQIFDLKEKLETPEVIVIDGDTVTPINDVEIWIKCAGIDDTYKYTTLTQVLADNTCMYSLTSDENSMKYLTRSTGFAEELCANENFMTYLGQSAYVDTSLLNSDLWLDGICNSTYFESVLNVKIPTMTGYTTPSGEAKASSEGSYNGIYYRSYCAFGSMDYGWYADNMSGSWIQYKFDNPVCMKKVKLHHVYQTTYVSNHVWKVSASNDGINFVDISDNISCPNFATDYISIINNKNERYMYYRVSFVSGNVLASGQGLKVQFYGME